MPDTIQTETIDGVEMIVRDAPFLQQVGGVTFKYNLETTAAQVKMPDGTNVETRMITLERAQTGTASLRLCQDIAARDALTGLIPGDQAWVIDATGDDTVDSGGAKYLWMADATWLKVGEEESMDMVIHWNDIVDGPTSTPTQVDDAVARKHSHDNYETLTHLSDDGANNLLYKGQRINDGKVWIANVDSLADIPANLADGGLIFLNQAPATPDPEPAP